MQQEGVELRQDELKGDLIDMNKKKITLEMIDERYENTELEKIIKRYLSLNVLKCLPRNQYEREELDKMFKDKVLSLKVKLDEENSHSHDSDEYCENSQGDKPGFHDAHNMSMS